MTNTVSLSAEASGLIHMRNEDRLMGLSRMEVIGGPGQSWFEERGKQRPLEGFPGVLLKSFARKGRWGEMRVLAGGKCGVQGFSFPKERGQTDLMLMERAQ